MNVLVDQYISGSFFVSGSVSPLSGSVVVGTGSNYSSPNGFFLKSDSANNITVFMYGANADPGSGYTFEAYSETVKYTTANSLQNFRFIANTSGSGTIRWMKV